EPVEQRLLLAVVARAGSGATAEGIAAALAERLPEHQRPDAVVLADELPHTADASGGPGKLLRREIRARYGARLRPPPPVRARARAARARHPPPLPGGAGARVRDPPPAPRRPVPSETVGCATGRPACSTGPPRPRNRGGEGAAHGPPRSRPA